MQFSAELQCVLAAGIGDMVDELYAGVRSLHLGPVKPAEFVREDIEAANVDPRQSVVERIGHARIQSISRCRRGVIVGERRLVKTVVSEASFIHPA